MNVFDNQKGNSENWDDDENNEIIKIIGETWENPIVSEKIKLIEIRVK